MYVIKRILPNLLTILRILIIPVIVISLYYHNDDYINYVIALIAFSTASITDFIDGYLARIWNTQSEVGKFLDPIADKLIISTSIIMLIYTGKIHGVNIFPSLAIISREILISGIREFMGNMNINIPVTFIAKIKTTLQMLAITLIILSNCNVFMSTQLDIMGEIMLWSAAILTVCSSYKYFKVLLKNLNS